MIYTKPAQEVSWDDIVSFCEQRLPEGAYLDYKKEFPKHLENTIAAMANTLGGIILLGVEEDAETKPILPLKGIRFEKGLAERITNIILTNITPPVFPEIAVCTDPTMRNALAMIRIHQSDQTPHAIAGNTRVYVRTGNRNTPEELATVDRIEWLRDRRSRSVALREALLRRASERATVLFQNSRS